MISAAPLAKQILAANADISAQLEDILNHQINTDAEPDPVETQKKQTNNFVFYVLWDEQYQNITAACTGTIIKDGWILTAGHCLLNCLKSDCSLIPVFPIRENALGVMDAKENQDFFLQPEYAKIAPQADTPKELLLAAEHDIGLIKIDGLNTSNPKELTVLSDGPENSFMLIHRLIDERPSYIVKTFPHKLIFDDVFATSQRLNEINEGDSGSALYTSKGEIVGVLNSFFGRMSEGSPKFNIFTPINQKNLDFIKQITN